MNASRIDVKISKGKVVVTAKGKTERGQSFIKGSQALQVETISDPKFKAEMAAAVTELLGIPA